MAADRGVGQPMSHQGEVESVWWSVLLLIAVVVLGFLLVQSPWQLAGMVGGLGIAAVSMLAIAGALALLGWARLRWWGR